MVTLLPVTLLPVPSSLPKLPTTTSRTLSPVTSASPIQEGLLLNVGKVPARDRLPAPSFWNTEKVPAPWPFSLLTTTSAQPSPLMSPTAAKLGFQPPVSSWILLNPPPCLPYRMMIVFPAPLALVVP